jgi:hypothetical protein
MEEGTSCPSRMVAKANRLKLAIGEDIVPNDCRLRARGSEVTGSSPDHSASAAEEPRPPLQSPTPPRGLIRLLIANQAKLSVRRHKKAQASQHSVVPKPSPSTSAHPAIQALNVLSRKMRRQLGIQLRVIHWNLGEKLINSQQPKNKIGMKLAAT